jgi:hypothetical protein
MLIRGLAKSVLIVATIVVMVVIAARSTVYVAFERGDSTALWNAHEAYLFVGARHFGHRVSYLQFPWFFTKNFLGAVESGDDVESLAVIHVTPSGVERHALSVEDAGPGGAPGYYAPRGGRIYTIYPARGGICFWAGDRFVAATPEEQQGFNGIEGLGEKHFDEGWSQRRFAVGPGEWDAAFSTQLDDNLKLVVNSSTTVFGYGTISVDLRRPDQKREAVLELHTRWGFVSKSEYERTFYRHP